MPTSQEDPIPQPAVDAQAEKDRLLIEYLADSDHPCPLCQYNLRALKTPRCPECGIRLRLNVGPAEPYMGAWIAAFVPACAGGGIGFLAIVIGALTGHFGEIFFGGFQDAPAVQLVLWWAVVDLVVAVVLVMRRRWFVLLGQGPQRSMAGVLIATNIIGFLIVVGYALRS
ncbi:MAG TPA: hypothetical protein VMD30_07810 [Tepidisphaeraceae bacterium]|nr:hypothetical protein [Tepidisphaeraceae bacterium]